MDVDDFAVAAEVLQLSRVEVVISDGAVEEAYDFVVDAVVLRDDRGRCDAADATTAALPAGNDCTLDRKCVVVVVAVVVVAVGVAGWE